MTTTAFDAKSQEEQAEAEKEAIEAAEGSVSKLILRNGDRFVVNGRFTTVASYIKKAAMGEGENGPLVYLELAGTSPTERIAVHHDSVHMLQEIK
jgi:hypothetical protein